MIWGYPISGNLHVWRSFAFLRWRTPKNQPTCSCHFHVIFNREHRETTGFGYPNLESNVWGGDCSNVWLNCHNTGNFACPEWPWAMPMTSTFVYGSKTQVQDTISNMDVHTYQEWINMIWSADAGTTVTDEKCHLLTWLCSASVPRMTFSTTRRPHDKGDITSCACRTLGQHPNPSNSQISSITIGNTIVRVSNIILNSLSCSRNLALAWQFHPHEPWFRGGLSHGELHITHLWDH